MGKKTEDLLGANESLFEHSRVEAPLASKGFETLRYHVERYQSGKMASRDMLKQAGIINPSTAQKAKPTQHYADITIQPNRQADMPSAQRDAVLEKAYNVLLQAKTDGVLGKAIINEPQLTGSDASITVRMTRSIYPNQQGKPSAKQLDKFDRAVQRMEQGVCDCLHGIGQSQSPLAKHAFVGLGEHCSVRRIDDGGGSIRHAACFECELKQTSAITEQISRQNRHRLTERELHQQLRPIKAQMMREAKQWLQEHLPDTVHVGLQHEPYLRLAVWQPYADEPAADAAFNDLKSLLEDSLSEFNLEYERTRRHKAPSNQR